ncbi:MAG: FecR domain-containing protein [Pseudomonadota bacterium]
MKEEDLSSQKELTREASRILLSVAESSPDEQSKALAAWAAGDSKRIAAASRAERVWSASAGTREAKPKKGKTGATVAGTLSVLLLLWFYPALERFILSDVSTGQEVRLDVPLAPGVTADLDAGTSLAFDLEGNDLVVRLRDGAAYFNATPDSGISVQVTADDVEVLVTGTRFAVESDGDSVNVAVEKGAVLVVASAEAGVTVEAGRSWRDGVLGRTDPLSVAAWREGWLDVEGAALERVANQLDRRFAGTIIFSDRQLAAASVTGRYRLDDPIAALRTAAAAHGGRVVMATPWVALVMPE